MKYQSYIIRVFIPAAGPYPAEQDDTPVRGDDWETVVRVVKRHKRGGIDHQVFGVDESGQMQEIVLTEDTQ